MDRRTFLKAIAYGTAIMGGPTAWQTAFADADGDTYVKDYLNKIKNYDSRHPEDILIKPEEKPILKACVNRLKRVQSTVGYANFSLLSFDDAVRVARTYSAVGEFSRKELDFLESVFYTSASVYGFYGKKVLTNLTANVQDKDVIKIPYTGHFLYRGAPRRLYYKIKREIGPSVTLTSGVRAIVKQMYLFLAKADNFDGNLSLASRSLAPPGHSFHGVGDFDVGKVGLGYKNFTEYFSGTDEYKKLTDLGYIKIRYTADNPYGVRFEPWHIKVV